MATNLIAQDSQVNQVDSLTEAWQNPWQSKPSTAKSVLKSMMMPAV